jgi:hypothetical protein
VSAAKVAPLTRGMSVAEPLRSTTTQAVSSIAPVTVAVASTSRLLVERRDRSRSIGHPSASAVRRRQPQARGRAHHVAGVLHRAEHRPLSPEDVVGQHCAVPVDVAGEPPPLVGEMVECNVGRSPSQRAEGGRQPAEAVRGHPPKVAEGERTELREVIWHDRCHHPHHVHAAASGTGMQNMMSPGRASAQMRQRDPEST